MRISTALLSACLATALAAPALALAAPGRTETPAAPQTRAAAAGEALTALGLTSDQKLVRFGVDRPSSASSLGTVSGLQGDAKLVGIDFRVQDRKLYGVGDRGGVYTLGARDAKAVKVSQLTVALSGTRFGVDFNPAANRLRVISDTGQNLRHNIDDTAGVPGTVADGLLTNPTTPPATAQGVTGAAYTNNDLSASTATTLFDLDTLADRVSLQSPANAGTLAPTGSLGLDAGPDAGFDVYFSDSEGANHGFATLHDGAAHHLYTVDLLTGATHDLGAFPARHQVTDIALPLHQH